MSTLVRFMLLFVGTVSLIAAGGCGEADPAHSEDGDHADHAGETDAGHDDDAESGEEDHADHAGETDAGHDDDAGPGDEDHTDHAEETDAGHNDEGESGEEGHSDVARLTQEQLSKAGVVIEPLQGGVIATHITLPAEVGLNQDSVLHVTPRVPGIVSEVHGFLGHEVLPGDLLAVLESPQLGEAKITFLQASQAEAIADAELTRQQTISANTATLLHLLREQPELEVLRAQVTGLPIGENKGTLLSAYAKVKAAEANYARERELREKGLSTEADLLAAEVAFNSHQAEYFGAFEDIDFTHHLRLQEAERSARVTASSVDNAERRLHLLGLSEEQVAGIASEPDSRVARYELTASTGGRIVAKHITPGEQVGPEGAIYKIADLSTVWLNISVYAQYTSDIREGQQVVVRVGERSATGSVDYVSAVVSEATRTVSARVVLDNTNGEWKPGEFVTAHVETGQARAERVVPIDAIQDYEGRKVVFVQDADGIEPVGVRLGRRNGTMIELLGDEIALGTPVVVRNSFLIKAELGKGAAGHDH
jgi:cobalt-zinc-cadmium efflux system membrane fusion protein